MVNPGAKVEMFLEEENVASLRNQRRPNVQRDKVTVTQMKDVLEIWFVDVTTAEIIIEMLHPMMTVVPLATIRIDLEVLISCDLLD